MPVGSRALWTPAGSRSLWKPAGSRAVWKASGVKGTVKAYGVKGTVDTSGIKGTGGRRNEDSFGREPRAMESSSQSVKSGMGQSNSECFTSYYHELDLPDFCFPGH